MVLLPMLLPAALLPTMLLAGCAGGSAGGLSLARIEGFIGRLLHGRPPAPPPPVHYVLEPAWNGGIVWFYPHESFTYDRTGIADVYGPGHAARTTDGEAFDPAALAAASQTLQLPAVARVTNLENGRQVELRINDRGPASPARVIEVTPRAAALLGFAADGAAQVRVQVDGAASHALAEALHGGAPPIEVASAPIGTVQQSALPPPPGARASGGPDASPAQAAPEAPPPPALAVPLRLPAVVTQAAPAPGTLWIDAGSFSRAEFANRRRAVLADTGAAVSRALIDGQASYSVRIGPLASVAEADRTLDRVIRDGVVDASIVVE